MRLKKYFYQVNALPWMHSKLVELSVWHKILKTSLLLSQNSKLVNSKRDSTGLHKQVPLWICTYIHSCHVDFYFPGPMKWMYFFQPYGFYTILPANKECYLKSKDFSFVLHIRLGQISSSIHSHVFTKNEFWIFTKKQ